MAWNLPGYNENRMNIMHAHGIVKLNALIDWTAIKWAGDNTNPLFARPEGQYSLSYQTVRTAEIAYRIRSGINSSIYEFRSQDARTEDIGVPAITALNGQGNAKQRESFISTIEIIGIVMQETEENNDSRFNIHTGGLHTITNNGNKAIEPGSWVMAYVPKQKEISSGGTDHPADKAGRVTLWYKQYDAAIHKFTPKGVYRCLTSNDEERKRFLPEYTRACNGFEQGYISNAIIVIKVLLDKGLLDIGPNMSQTGLNKKIAKSLGQKGKWSSVRNNTRKALYVMMALSYMLGSYRFVDMEGSTNKSDVKKNGIISTIRQHLYIPYSKKNGDPMPYLFTRTDTATKSSIRRGTKGEKIEKDKSLFESLQTDAAQLPLIAQASLLHHVVDTILGKAQTGATPGKDLELQGARYAR